jgi:TolB-like protein/Flp pilus assembly protein TadD
MIGNKIGPYEILASIGSGGMGEVWKARDTRLGRIVAIKKVKEQHSERFKQEARSIAALNHTNICQLFDIGLATQIATALEEAHRHGIIHRDLKPSNIMVTDKGAVKLLDFGLAKLYEQDAAVSSLPTADAPATQAGAILGTVAYMSPEQAQGRPADARSDIFSFGLVLYEMLSGRRAFSGGSSFALMTAIVKEEPPPLQASPSLGRIVMRCLEKNPSDRYQTMAEVRTALEKVPEEKVAKSPAEPQPSIAVLPFADMSPGKDNEWFSDGLAEEIINALTKIPGLKVIARTSAFAFKGKEQDIRRIAEALGVSSILEGSVRKAGERIRATAQLINASDGSHLWSERYDRDMTDVFAIQDEISQKIAQKLRIQFSVDRPLTKKTENIEAYNLNLKGRYYFFKLTPDGLAKSKEYFKQAIALDPNYASPWHGLAAMYGTSGILGFAPPKTVYEQSRRLIMKALELDNTLPEAHAHMGGLLAFEFDWKGAEREFLRALELGPRIWDVEYLYSYCYLIPMRRLKEALDAIQKAHQLDPLSPNIHTWLGYIYITMKQYDRAIEQFKNALELDPHSLLANGYIGCAHVLKGELNEGIQILEAVTHLPGRIPIMQGWLGYAYAIAGRTGDAHRILEELQSVARTSYVPPNNIALIYLGLGETEKALDWLETAADEHSILFLHPNSFPGWEPLHSHPRFKNLLRKMNLET